MTTATSLASATNALAPTPTRRARCVHCGLDVPSGFVQAQQQHQFCCHGCRSAYALIHEHGLDAYYSLVDGESERKPVDPRGCRFAHFDDPAFVAAHMQQLEDGHHSIRLGLDGMHCAACVWLLEKLPEIVPGVARASVRWQRSTIDIEWSAQTRLSTIAETIAKLGYDPHPIASSEANRRETNESRRHFVAMGIAGAAAGNNMLIAVALYLGMFSYMSLPVESLLRWASCLIGWVALLGPGRVFLRGALAALRTRTPHMDLPIALGLIVGTAAGTINVVRGSGEIYFDTLCVLVFLLLVGRFIQYRQQRQASAAVELLYRLTPRTAHRVGADGTVEVALESVEPGDILRVKAGQTVPADGTITRGRSTFDQAILTGESRPVAAEIGDRVAAGTLNMHAAIDFRVESIGTDTRIGKVLELVEQSSLHRPQVVQLADRIAGYFIATVVIAALLTLGGWLWLDASHAIERSVALLIVACPCALGLATPLSLAAAIGQCARRQLLIKGADVMQLVSRPAMIWLDKTGTLTQGKARVIEWYGDAAVRSAVAALESHSTHPMAVPLADGRGESLVVEDVAQSELGGIHGVVQGHKLDVGNAAFMRCRGIVVSRRWLERSEAAAARLQSPVFVAQNGELVAMATIGDPLRPDATRSIAKLRERGFEVGILSGDHPDIVRGVALRLGVTLDRAHGGLTPAQKVEFVRRTQSESRTVLMVGDGVNDSAALAAASVGIATSDGAEASLQAADVYLGRPGLEGIIDLIDTGSRTIRRIKASFGVSLAYNALGIGLAAAGWISPLTAAILMPLSSLSVVALALGHGRNKAS